MVFEQAEKIRPLPWYRRDLGWWPGAVAAFVMLDCGMALTHPTARAPDPLVAELDALNRDGGVVRRSTAHECRDVVRIVRQRYGLELGTSGEWVTDEGTVGWAWEGDRCLFMAQHLPAPTSTR